MISIFENLLTITYPHSFIHYYSMSRRLVPPLARLLLPDLEMFEYGIDLSPRLVELIPCLSSCDNYLAFRKDQEHDLVGQSFLLIHLIHKPGEGLRLIRRIIAMRFMQPLQPNQHLAVAAPHDVLDLPFLELGLEPLLLHDASEFPGCQLGVVFRLGAGDDDATRREDQGRGSGIADADDYGGEALFVVLGVARLAGENVEVDSAAKVEGGNDVLQLWVD